MSRRSSGRSFVGLILEIGFIALVVSILPKLNFLPQPPANSPNVAWQRPMISTPESENPWWQAEPSARATSYRADESQPVNVEQTLENSSQRLIGSVTEYAGRAAQDLLASPNAQPPSEPSPHQWRRY
jgi:hypothetical protein